MLGVHEEESPMRNYWSSYIQSKLDAQKNAAAMVAKGEPMKPLSELVKEWRSYGKDYDHCADELQAWRREAEAWTWHEADRDGAICVSDILSGLLGTTQSSGKGEK